MKLSEIKKNVTAISAGQWVDHIPGMGDLRLRVRGLSSPVAAAVRARKERAVPRKDRERDGSIKHDVALRIMGEVLHECILLDWEGVLDDKGKPLAYDPELAKQLCTDPEWIEFADAVAWSSKVADHGDLTEEVVGN